MLASASKYANPDARKVEGNVLISREDPRLALRLGEPFEYVGIHEFDIRGIAGGTRHVWVDAEDKLIRRMFIVQLEGFYPDNEGQYHYDLSRSPDIAGYRWRSNGFAFDLAQAREESPGNESSVTAGFLEELGYELPSLIMMWRSLTVVNEAKTHEAILFLMESGDQHNLSIEDLYQEDIDTRLWSEIQARLQTDFQATVELSTLNDAGEIVGEWMRIP